MLTQLVFCIQLWMTSGNEFKSVKRRTLESLMKFYWHVSQTHLKQNAAFRISVRTKVRMDLIQ